MALPQAIQRAQELADQEIARLAAQQQPQVLTDASQIPAPAAPAPAPVETPPAPAATPPAPAPAAPQAEDFKQKFLSLQGIFNTQMPRMQQALAEKDQVLAQMRQELDALKQARTAEPPPKPAANPKDVENFGAEMIDMVQRHAQQVFDAMSQRFAQTAQNLDQRLGQLEQLVNGVRQETVLTREDGFFRDLARAVPDWEAINVSPAFLAWLGEVDPIYRVPRKAALDRAHSQLDAEGAIAVFSAFKATQAPAPTPSTPGGSLESQVAPSSVGSTPPAPVQQPQFVVTQKLIRQFYLDVQRGVYRGREQEAAQLEAEINRAVVEGRVR